MKNSFGSAPRRGILELVDYASNMAEHQLLPGARQAVQRSGYLLLRKLAARYGAPEDVELVAKRSFLFDFPLGNEENQ